MFLRAAPRRPDGDIPYSPTTLEIPAATDGSDSALRRGEKKRYRESFLITFSTANSHEDFARCLPLPKSFKRNLK